MPLQTGEETETNKINLIFSSNQGFMKHHTCISDVICVLESRKASLLSSKDCSISSGISSAGLVMKGIGGAGVMAVCIGIDAVEGVEGTGIGIAFGVVFSSSTKEVVFKGVVYDRSLVGIVFCKVSPLSSSMFVILAFDDTVEEMGENGLRTNGDSSSLAFTALEECFRTGMSAMSRPLLTAKC